MSVVGSGDSPGLASSNALVVFEYYAWVWIFLGVGDFQHSRVCGERGDVHIGTRVTETSRQNRPAVDNRFVRKPTASWLRRCGVLSSLHLRRWPVPGKCVPRGTGFTFGGGGSRAPTFRICASGWNSNSALLAPRMFRRPCARRCMTVRQPSALCVRQTSS